MMEVVYMFLATAAMALAIGLAGGILRWVDSWVADRYLSLTEEIKRLKDKVTELREDNYRLVKRNEGLTDAAGQSPVLRLAAWKHDNASGGFCLSDATATGYALLELYDKQNDVIVRGPSLGASDNPVEALTHLVGDALEEWEKKLEA